MGGTDAAQNKEATMSKPDTIQVNVPATVEWTDSLLGKVSVDLRSIDPKTRAAFVAHFAAHGLKQTVGDKGAAPKGTPEGKKARMREDMLAKVQGGHIPTGGGGRSGDPWVTFAKQLLRRAKVRNAAKAPYTAATLKGVTTRADVEAFMVEHFGKQRAAALGKRVDTMIELADVDDLAEE